MIINGCVVQGIDEDNEEMVAGIKEFLDLNNVNDGVENEALGILDTKTRKISVIDDVDGDDFSIVIKNIETNDETYRFISTNQIDNIFEREAEEYFDDDQWRDEVANGATEDGLEEWQQWNIENYEYAELLSSYDSSYHDELDDYHVFRT